MNTAPSGIPVTYLRAIWCLAKKAGLSEDELRDLVERESGQRSTRSLGRGQALAVIDYLKRIDEAGSPPPRRVYPARRRPVREGRVVPLAREEQRRLIDWFLRERLDLGGKDPAQYLATMCGRMFHRDHYRTAREAGLVIGNLRRQAERQAREGRIPVFVAFGGERDAHQTRE